MEDKLSKIDDIVAMLDSQVEKGTGHINVSVDPNQNGDTTQTMGCIDCAKGDLACQVPTLMEGLDDKFADDEE